MSKFRQRITTKHKQHKTKLKEYLLSSLSINEHRVDNKNTFKYLGTKLTNDQTRAGNTEIKHRKIQDSQEASQKIQNKFGNKNTFPKQVGEV